MGAVACFHCLSSNVNTEENYGHLNVDIKAEPSSDQLMTYETKIGTFGVETFKKKKTIKIDKGDFVRLKADNFFDEY